MSNELLPWHEAQWRQLMQRQAEGRLPHALLCMGSEGLGKQDFAQRLAQSLLCQRPTVDGSACGGCQACHLFIAGSHPDYRLVAAEENGPIKVDQIRRLNALFSYTSRGHKVALLIAAERMNINAANSLLKTLEEPPGNSVLLLVSTNPARLPATIRSRCQKVSFQHPPEAQALTWLASKLDRETDLALALSLTGGAPLTALNWAAGQGLKQRRDLFKSYGQVLTRQIDPVQAAQVWIKGDVLENLRWLIAWQMDMIRLKMMVDPPRLLNPDLKAPLRRLAVSLPPQTLFRHLDEAVRLRRLCETQVNRSLMIEAFLGNTVDS